MENRELLDQFVDSIVKDADSAEAAFKQFITLKASSMVSEIKAKKAFNDKLTEQFGSDAIQFNGNDVLVNNKVVGQVKTDLSETDSAIDFISADGKFSKEFVDIPSLYQYLAKTFGLGENSITGNLGTKIPDPKKLDVGSEEEPKLPSGDGAADLKGKTKGAFNPDAETAQGETPRVKKLKSLADSIKKGARPTSTTVTEDEKILDENGEWTMKNKDVDANKGSKLKTQVKKMRTKADKSGNAK